ncbi:hypothetical protein BD779DRAFT_1608382 [Infundibulicybe gibba]|nr:hypothetical protein BD779DRAFT_1608382 [Infundibulicybe gibba]
MIIAPDEVLWMDEDAGLSTIQYAQRAYTDILQRFNRPLHETSADSRMRLAKQLLRLPCLLAFCDGSDCISNPGPHALNTIPTCLPFVVRLVDGTDEEVTPLLYCQVFSSLSCLMKHHNMYVPDGLDRAARAIFRGLVHKDRNTRLSAGNCVSAMIHKYATKDSTAWKQTEPIFGKLRQNLQGAKTQFKETILVSLGSIGKTANGEILGQVLPLLVGQLGHPNPIINGVTTMQLLSIAKFYNKTLSSLLLPYMDQIAPFIISNLHKQPILLTELCRITSMAPVDFISFTLPRTLPSLFANSDLHILDIIARDLSVKPLSLFLDYSSEILAHIFLLPGPGQTRKALTFVIKIFTDAAQNSSIDIQTVVKSCIVPLLAVLVMEMGDEDEEACSMAVAALKKVERIMMVAPNRGRTLPAPDLGAFLKTYMLGLISEINDSLQDVRGKKTVTAKRKILRGLGALINQIGPPVNNVSPQIMATFQTMVGIPELSEITLESWHSFLSTLRPRDIGPHVGPTSAAFISSWPSLSPSAREMAIRILDYIVIQSGHELGKHLDDIVDLAGIPELNYIYRRLVDLRSTRTPKELLQHILDRSSSDNLTVAAQSLGEFKKFMLNDHKDFIIEISSGDMFDPLVGQILSSLFAIACRDGDGTEVLRLLAFECIGILGAVDPDRCEIPFKDPTVVVRNNFTDEGESVKFALHLITDLLVGAFRSTSDIKYQGHLAYTIQELLRFCQFTPALVAAGANTSVPVKHVLETVTPLLEARFALNTVSTPDLQHPIYPKQSTYREWIQLWTTHLITKASGETAQKIFGVFRSAVRSRDVVVAHHLLPHLVLNILISGDEGDIQAIRFELLVVLEDQVDLTSSSTADKKLLSAQAVFMLLDHLNKWVRLVRQDISTKKAESKRSRPNQLATRAEEQLLRVDSVLSSIDNNLMAKAALQCKSYARALMNFERQIHTIQKHSPHNKDLQTTYYERLHEIYSHLDEPDGMEGVSTLILSPSLEHQIRQHESTGHWTSAQSCWEVRLQQSPDNVDYHLGLLRCLRNLGHYDTLRTHVRGVLTRNPGWEDALIDFQVESAWIIGAWDDVKRLVQDTTTQTSSVAIARLLLAMQTGDQENVVEAAAAARSVLGTPITAAGVKGYRRSYEAVLGLHLTHELEMMNGTRNHLSTESPDALDLTRRLFSRFDATLPTFRTREPILSMRRIAYTLSCGREQKLTEEIGKSWLASAKIARKAGQWQTAYSAMLQARQSQTQFSFMESAKLLKAEGEPLRALQELENSMRLLGMLDSQSTDVGSSMNPTEMKKMTAKAQILRARWMIESERFELNLIMNVFTEATNLAPSWESAHFHLGQFHDDCFKNLSRLEQKNRGMRMNLSTVRSFAKAIKFGSKYVYQTVPRLLTIWLDLGEDPDLAKTDVFKKLNDAAARATRESPIYKWFTAFPQIVSRVGHSNDEVYSHLARLIAKVMEEYPKQALWFFTSVVKSKQRNRGQRGKAILDQLRNNPNTSNPEIKTLISQCISMTNELLELCDYHIDGDKKTLMMSRDFPRLSSLGHSSLIIPLQESLTANLPPASSSDSIHQPFPMNAPTFDGFSDEIDIMHSLAKPRKITITGSDGQKYMFLGKPKDDLRKDARLMDFNAIINKLLKANSESRRRQLYIRTYGVVTLNEECGFIQWVPHTIPIRPVLLKSYDARRIRNWTPEMGEVFKRIKDASDKDAGVLFGTKILPLFPPVFHEWFLETFPEPTVWLSSRLAYGRTAAVMSMVGFILGLGDRHTENILLDTISGDAVHVDFNCLFEKGKTLETPERVPFRLTQNMIDGLGVTGTEGVFRTACEVTLDLLRDNKDSLMSVLDAFIHDPLVEWEDEKRKLERDTARRNQVKASVDLRMLAKNALNPIEKKLKGIYTTSRERHEKEISTSNLVQMLIQQATDLANLGKMYPGWSSWH